MIHSASSSSSSAARNDAIAAASANAGQRIARGPTDQISIDKGAALRLSLQQAPEIRPEVVERGRALLADPAYPTNEIIRHIGAMIVNSPDLSEDLS